ncbi:5'-3' exonuclease [Aquibacillus rhizosphaerae]|uniref:5'-3' exonuclease n=1 Tax=Aquibacillus rhizosphaerae TaxID=3051431 RepID=A0ABT7L150_9BACI|nr:5'-3' exonuclease H3TH domain-containing protein [Aquibacillus sp. LR5S19]MDL4839574.1 5'-3' exonuclease H3TH domain-containing protein [Aquibacillus sp. LR5S19]
MNDNSKVLLVDGMALLFRGFYATAYTGNFMINSKGIPTNGIYGFLNYFIDSIQTFSPSHVICCWDMGSKTFRSEIYDQYKSNRGEPPIELVPQFDLIKEVVEAFEVPNIGIKGYEADDCIGTLANHYSKEQDVLIVTGDQDMLQLVDKRVSVALMKKGTGNYDVHTHDTFHEQKGILPLQVIDLKGLMGDSSDNYPGVKGIGEKTALKLIKEFGSIDELLNNLDNVSKGIKKKIEENLEMLHLSRNLAKIHCEVPISCSLEDALWRMDNERVVTKLEDLEFKNVSRWMNKVI